MSIKKNKDRSGLYATLLFLLWPILAVISAFKNYRSHWAKNILWAFVAFYGFSFAIGVENQNSDIVRYVAEVKYLHGLRMTLGDAWYYYLQSGEVDILRTLVAVVLSRFTDSQAIVTLTYGAIFGFFFSRNIWYVLEHLKGKMEPITILLLVCFFLLVPIWYLNGFRMWTAAHVFIYGLLPFLFEGKKKGLIIASLAIMVHFAFIIPVGVLITYLLLGNRLTIYFAFFLATFFISEINLSVVNTLVEDYAPEVLKERTESHRDEQTVEAYKEKVTGQVWYVVWYDRAIKWSIMGFLAVLFLKGFKFFKKNERWASWLSFSLFYYGVANLLTSLPSGGRYLAVGNLAALALIILYVQNREHEVVMKRFIIVATPALLLFVVVSLRKGFYSMSATTILGNPVISLFLNGQHISLNDVMRMII